MAGKFDNVFVPLPRRNVWRMLFDIRPAGVSCDSAARISQSVDLRRPIPGAPLVWRIRKISDAAAPEVQVVFDRSRTGRKILGRAVAVFAVSVVVWLIVWGMNFAAGYVASRKDDIFKAAGEIAQHAERGQEAVKVMDFENAKIEFSAAAELISDLEKSIGPALYAVSLSSRVLPENDYLKAALMLQDAREAFVLSADIADLGRRLASNFSSSIFSEKSDLPELLADMRYKVERLNDALSNIERRKNAFVEVMAGVWIENIPQEKLLLEEAGRALAAAEKLLGAKNPQNVLLLFQNPAELRATGGFIGSYGVLKLENGAVKEFTVDDIYNPDGQLDEYVMPPRPLLRVTPVWGARDANWFFDFRLSAKKVADFLEKTTDIHFDAVISVNPQVVASLVGVSGNVEMPEYEKTITSDNLWEEMQFQTRAGKDRLRNQPKRFLTIFGPRLLENLKIISSEDMVGVRGIIEKGLAEKDIMMWAEDPDLEKLIEEREWDGGVVKPESGRDYLAVVISNIGGAKADYVMRQNYHLQTTIGPTGETTNTLRITRTHDGYGAKYSWWNARNVSYIRVFVPVGSILIDVSGAADEPKLIDVEKQIADYSFDSDVASTVGTAIRLEDENVDVFEESKKTVFGVWQIVDPGQSRTITIRYQLPFKIGFSPPHYSLYFQKQSGVPAIFQHTAELPVGSRIMKVLSSDKEITPTAAFDRYSWIGEEMLRDIKHTITFRFRK